PGLDRDLYLPSIDLEGNLHAERTLLPRCRHLERALHHGAGERLAIGGAGMDVVIRIDCGTTGSIGFGDGRLVDGRCVKNGLHTRHPWRPFGNPNAPDMGVGRLAPRVGIVEYRRSRESKIATSTCEFLKAPSPPRRPGRQPNFDNDFVCCKCRSERALK